MHTARQIEACKALLPTVDPRHRAVAERSLLALRAAQVEAEAGDMAGARLTMVMGMSELLPVALAAHAERSTRRIAA